MKTTKKFLSIILAILMIATSVPFAFAADCVHDNSGEHTCLGYYCGDCDSYYGEPGPHWWISDWCMVCEETHEHKGNAGTICMGTLCDICYYPYGEVTDPDAHRWNKDGTCGYCGAECEHPSYTNGLCSVCGYSCVHENYTDGKCDNCGTECNHSFTKYEEIEAPTCTETGLEIAGCANNCGATAEKEIPALEHIDDNGDYKCDYDCSYVFEHNCYQMLVLNDDIKTPVTCSTCGSTIYESDNRWAEDIYENYFEGAVAKFKGHGEGVTDEIVAYYVVKPSAGENFKLSFDWAVNQGFTSYGGFRLHLYHNDNEVITHDFTQYANPYDSVLSEKYLYTADGEYQVFKFVFEKTNRGNWNDDGRKAFLSNIKNEIETECDKIGHEFVTYVKSAEASCGVNAKETAKCKNCEVTDTREIANTALEHIDENGDYKCDNDCSYVFEHNCDQMLVLDGDIKTPVTCSACDSTIYESDNRWAEDIYENYFEGAVAKFKGYGEGVTDEIVAYYVVKTSAGENCKLSFDWAINQDFTAYGGFKLHLYHNDNEVITRDFTQSANPHDSVLSEKYLYTADGEYQVFKFVFEKTNRGNWNDDGRKAFLSNIKNEIATECEVRGHEFVTYEKSAEASCGVNAKETAKCKNCEVTDTREIANTALEHIPLEAVKEKEVAPKCGVAGSYELAVYCDLCDDVLERETVTVAALEHKDDDGDGFCDYNCGSDGIKTILDVSKGYIVIADSYVTLGNETVEVDPDGYIVTGKAEGDIPLKFINDSGLSITFDLVFNNLSLTAWNWCSVIEIEDKSPITLNIVCEGSNAISSDNHPVFNNTKAQTSITINITKTEGSSFTFERRSYQENGILFSKDDTNTFVYINGKQLDAAAQCYVHKNIDGIQDCRGYLCDNCGQYFGEADADNHSFTKYEEVEAPKCGVAGKEVAVCDNNCGATDEKEIPALEHEPLESVKENEVNATCKADGSYDLVVYCDLCGEELDRDTFTVDALTHEPLEAVVENEVNATCKADGSYDLVVYCDLCGEELDRDTFTVDALTHEPLEAVVENEVNATCKADGSYDLVVYCDLCGEELSSEHVITEKLPHTPSGWWATTDTEHYKHCVNDSCDEEIEGTRAAHTYTWKVTTEATATTDGVETGTCVCGYETTRVIPATGETPDPDPEPGTPDEPTDDTCDHLCHSNSAFVQFFWKIIRFLQKLFGIQQYCDCGVAHW